MTRFLSDKAHSSVNPRRAITRVEVIVLAVIFLLGLALLTPVILRTRENSRKAACANHLRQIGIGCDLHRELNRWLPDGGESPEAVRSWSRGSPAIVPDQAWGWGYQLLPYLNQERVWQQLHASKIQAKDLGRHPGPFHELWANPDGAVVRATTIRLYFCPSRRLPVAGNGWAKIDYAGNGGSDEVNGRNGAIVRRGGLGPLDLKDFPRGTQYTLLIAEKGFSPDAGFEQPGDALGYTAGFGRDTIRWAHLPPLRDSTDAAISTRFGSAHPQSMNALFADGSVRPITYAVSLEVFQGQCLRYHIAVADTAIDAARAAVLGAAQALQGR